jgi:two-component system, chemotaxis family, protein-glutamate methylesterase/glutaminase
VEQNPVVYDFAVVAVRASLGGVQAMGELFAALPRDIPAAIVAVLHVGPTSMLPNIPNRRSPFAAAHARQGDALRAGQIYVAPPDHHMLVEQGSLVLTRGPKVNWVRPAIDSLFYTVAMSFGPSVIGVLLTGRLNDGTIGLGEIKRRGGVTMVQDPADAFCGEMPTNALKHVAVDYSVPLKDMPPLLDRVARQIATQGRKTVGRE